MDLNRFDTRENAEQGITIDLVIDGETIMGDDDKPVTFTLKGVADTDVHAAVLQSMKKDARTPKEVLEMDMKLGRAAVTGWSDNFEVKGEKYPYSRKNVEVILSIPLIRKAVLSHVFDEFSFMNGS